MIYHIFMPNTGEAKYTHLPNMYPNSLFLIPSVILSNTETLSSLYLHVVSCLNSPRSKQNKKLLKSYIFLLEMVACGYDKINTK